VNFCGIDVGSVSAQAVLMRDGQLVAGSNLPVRPSPVDSAAAVLEALLAEAGLPAETNRRTVATGYGRQQVEAAGLADTNLSEISCHAAGAHLLRPATRTVVDVGGQDAKVIRVSNDGGLEDFVMNDKCASGTGRFLEAMSRALGVSVEELGPLSFGASRRLELASRCSIFCETEVHHHLQRATAAADLAAGINRAIAGRIAALARRVGVAAEVMMTGGVAKNEGVRVALERRLQLRLVRCPVEPQLVGALGAAVLAARPESAGAADGRRGAAP
jgi:predicted CoA-substrate-specific enzyme activase